MYLKQKMTHIKDSNRSSVCACSSHNNSTQVGNIDKAEKTVAALELKTQQYPTHTISKVQYLANLDKEGSHEATLEPASEQYKLHTTYIDNLDNISKRVRLEAIVETAPKQYEPNLSNITAEYNRLSLIHI